MKEGWKGGRKFRRKTEKGKYVRMRERKEGRKIDEVFTNVGRKGNKKENKRVRKEERWKGKRREEERKEKIRY